MVDDNRFKIEQTCVVPSLKKTPGSLEMSPLSSEKFLQDKHQRKNTKKIKGGKEQHSIQETPKVMTLQVKVK
jgi:hypothetical protein